MPPSLISVPRPGTTVVEKPFEVTTRTVKSTGRRSHRRVFSDFSMVHHHRSKDEFPQITKGKYAPGYRYTMAAPKFVRTEPLDWSVICLTSVRHCESAGTIRRRSRRGDGDSMPAHGAGGHCR